jgi:hypothetical protein
LVRRRPWVQFPPWAPPAGNGGFEFMAGLGPRRSRPVRTRPGAFAEREALAILDQANASTVMASGVEVGRTGQCTAMFCFTQREDTRP